MTDERFADAMAFFAITYGAEYSQKQQTMWRVQIERHDITDDEFDAALDKFLMTKESNFMPRTPGAVLHYVVEAREHAQIEGVPTVADALWEVRETLNRYQGQPKYSHPIIAKAVATIGYYRLCEMTSEDISREFRVTYGELRKHVLDKPIEERPMVEGRRSGMGSIGDSLRSLPGLLGGCK